MACGYLVLEDGTAYKGELFGSEADAFGEVVFSTGMDGYQESLTDPSFRGQILVTTYPLVGDYGTVDEFDQSSAVHTRGLVVREYCRHPSAMYKGDTLDSYMKRHGIPGISGIDTRDLVIKLRTEGTVRGAIVGGDVDVEEAVRKVRSMPLPSDGNLVAEVSCKSIQSYDDGRGCRVGVLDCGTKSGIIRDMRARFDVVQFPYDTPADVIIESGVKGILVTNGPGDPSHPAIGRTVVKAISDLSSQMPIYGICYGSQVIARALGATTYKMKFGHRGCNQPVKYEGRVYITSQNHGYAVDEASLEGTGLVADQINVNDGTVEGVRHRDLPIFTSQYHPEASPGPTDTAFLFDRFARMIKEAKR
ncbi:MAG: glutamine-hydrolyzing carbamoyl-phosphate synthase small subunit [Candidatus Methanomethylophilaceae archaeon]|nr:glutamine-hydrolyzing carbamoyl-phosphate synthase small subunit [Candidatus Methanomethylophilaceae archaeon]